MNVFQFGKHRAKTKGFKPSASEFSSFASFMLEPILTPTAGIDGGDDVPDLAVFRPDDHGLHPHDFSEVPLVSSDESDSFNSHSVINHSGDLVQQIALTDTAKQPSDLVTSHLPDVPDFTFPSPQFESGFFTVGATGQVSVDFVFDGGAYQGQLAIFSLDGMDHFQLGSEDFIREVAHRALSHSDLGHMVIDDASDAARFSGSLSYEGDFNSGDYQGVKTFAMRPGDRVGFMLVPDGTVQQVWENPTIEGSHRPLFSMATANPHDGFQSGQIADVNGDGNTFVFEDLRVDGHSDLDYNDVIFQVRGATGEAQHLDEVIDSNHDWRTTDMGKALIAYTQPYLNPTDAIDFHDHTNPSLPTGTVPIFSPLVITEPDGYDFPVADQPLIGVIDTGINSNNPYLNYSQIQPGLDRVGGDTDPFLQPFEGVEHGTHTVGTISDVNDDATIWVGRAVGSQEWSNSLIEFVDAAKTSNQPNAVVNLSFDLAQVNLDDSITPRYEFTSAEWAALEYAHQNNVIVVAAAGNDNGGISALGQASQKFDNIITVGSAEQTNSAVSIAQGFDRADYSRYGESLTLMAEGGTEANPVLAPFGESIGEMHGTSVAAAKVTGAVSQVWATNPLLSFQQVIDILKSTSVDLTTPNWDMETGAGLLNIMAAVHLAKATAPEPVQPKVVTPPTTWSSGVMPIELATNVTEVNFTGKVAATIGARVRSGPGTNFSQVGSRSYNTTVSFNAWTTGGFVPDQGLGLGSSDRWYRIAGTTDQWISATIINGQPPNPPQPPQPPDFKIINGFRIDGVFYPVWKQYRNTLNNPTSSVINHSSGARYQLFQGGLIVNSQFGTFPLYGAIRQAYLNNAGLNGWLGAPKSGEQGLGNGSIRQDFANGYIIWNGRTATVYRNGSTPPTQPTPGQPTPINSNKFYKPLSSYTVTSRFGSRSYWYQGRWVTDIHTGIDLAAPSGTPVMAAKGGTVVFAGWNTQGYGNLIIVDHGNGQRTYYAHLSQISINNGATVSAGQAIGKVGSTGNSTGSHLHFEVRMNGVAQNPQSYLQF